MGKIELHPARSDDIGRLCALQNRAEAFDGVPRILVEAELREELDDVRVVLATDVRLAVVDDQLAGYIYTLHLPSDVLQERCFVFGSVDPEWRRRGVGTALLRWGIDRSTEQLRSSTNDLPKYIRVNAYDHQQPAHLLFGQLGFTEARWFEDLLRPLTDVPPPVQVDGIEIVPWPEDRDEECRVTKNESFLDHWGSTPTSPENWDQMVRGFGSRADLSFVALERATDRVVAVCVNHRYEADDELLGRRDGWIDTLGTLAEWRGKGLASALIIQSLNAFVAAGLTHASIGVDGASLTGAARLYRSLGFELSQRTIMHEIQVA